MSARHRRRAHPEAQLQRSLIDNLRWCARSDVWWAHIPNGGGRTAIEGAIFKSLGVQPGAPDLLIVRAGQALFIELKAPGRKLSPAQIECHEALRRAGATVETADNIDQALAFLRRLGVLR
jgi:VRR-NUC domain